MGVSEMLSDYIQVCRDLSKNEKASVIQYLLYNGLSREFAIMVYPELSRFFKKQ